MLSFLFEGCCMTNFDNAEKAACVRKFWSYWWGIYKRSVQCTSKFSTLIPSTQHTSVSFIVSLSTSALSHCKPASALTNHDNYCSQGHNTRIIVYDISFTVSDRISLRYTDQSFSAD